MKLQLLTYFCAVTSNYISWDVLHERLIVPCEILVIKLYIFKNIYEGAYNYISWATCEVSPNISHEITV
jgi:hypothetical protein